MYRIAYKIKKDGVIMVSDLVSILETFYQNHLPKRKEYITLYRAFSDYVNSHVAPETDAEDFISNRLNSNDIIESCVQYFNLSRAYKESGITKYLNAMTYMYRNCFQARGWNNPTLEKSLPFSTQTDEVKRRLKQLPEKNAPIPPVSDYQYEKVSEYLNDEFIIKNSLAKQQFYLICNLFLFLGFKFERLTDFRISDYLRDERSLSIRCEGGVTVKVRLPNPIVEHFESYLRGRDGRSYDYLFADTKGKRITPSFLEPHFKPLRKRHAQEEAPKNYNATGFAKFGVINLLRAGLEPYFVQMITGMDQIIMDDCVKIYLQEKYSRLNDSKWLTDFFNAAIGNIQTFQRWP